MHGQEEMLVSPTLCLWDLSCTNVGDGRNAELPSSLVVRWWSSVLPRVQGVHLALHCNLLFLAPFKTTL